MADKKDQKYYLKPYDAIASSYERYSKGKEAYLCSVENEIFKRLKDGDRLLDIGSGDGRRLKRILDKFPLISAVAVEPSVEMAKICRARTGLAVHEIFSEDLDALDLGEVDVVTVMWNVLGHIPSGQLRLKALENIFKTLRPGGRLLIDVNNRHNSETYGFFNVLIRRFVDFVNFDERRGNAEFIWKIEGKEYEAKGHLFTPDEFLKLIKKVGFEVVDSCTINYESGEISKSLFKGQLFFHLERK